MYYVTMRTLSPANTSAHRTADAGMKTRWEVGVNFCHCLHPVPVVPNERPVGLPEESSVWYKGLGESVPCLSTKMLVTAHPCQRLPPGTHMMVSIGFDDSLEGLSGSSKAVVLTDTVCTANGYRLIGMYQ